MANDERDAPFSETESEISLLLRSGFTALYLVSWEEERIEESLRKVATRLSPKRHLFSWRSTQGLVRHLPDPSRLVREEADLIEALRLIRRFPEDHAFSPVQDEEPKAIFVFFDIHRFWDQTAGGDEARGVVRRFRDLAREFSGGGHTWIVVSPRECIPEELQKDLTVLDYPLPDEDCLEGILRELEEGLRSDRRIAFDSPEERRDLLKNCRGLTAREAENVLAKLHCLANDQTRPSPAMRELVQAVISEKAQIIRKSGVLEYLEAGAIEDVGGLDRLKEWIRRKAAILKRQDEARRDNLPIPKGVMFCGIPGCGKSLMAQTVARELNRPLIRLDVGRAFGPYIGTSEENIRMAIRIAEGIAPVVLWIDEVEKAFAGTNGGGDSGTAARVFGTFLSWLQEKKTDVFVVCTANDLKDLPEEFKRKGRFDEVFFIDLPSDRDRREILVKKLSAQGIPAEGFDLAQLVGATSGFSGAEIQQGITDAHEAAFVEGTDLSEQRLVDAFDAARSTSTAVRAADDVQKRRDQGRHYPRASE